MALDWYRVRSPSWNLGSCPYSWGVGHGLVRGTELSCPLLKGCPTCLGAVTHAGGLEGALQPALLGDHLLLPALALVGQQQAPGLAAPWGRGGRGSGGGQRPQPRSSPLGKSGVDGSWMRRQDTD